MAKVDYTSLPNPVKDSFIQAFATFLYLNQHVHTVIFNPRMPQAYVYAPSRNSGFTTPGNRYLT